MSTTHIPKPYSTSLALRALLTSSSLTPAQRPPRAATNAVSRFATDREALTKLLTDGIAAARSLIANPTPYRIDVRQLQGMIDGVEAILDTPEAAEVALPADAFDLLRECIRAEKARKLKAGNPATVIEVICARGAAAMFAFSNARLAEAGR